MAKAYYNENDACCADWLENLVAAGLLPDGDVDRRDIREVRPGDLAGYRQCHFFSGVGGWPHALRLAGWPDSQRIWSGSCPCQPWSNGRIWHTESRGVRDARDLWPAWHDLIAECRPDTIIGEQTNSALALEWLDRAFDDLEGAGYACGAADLPACSVGAPQRRGRLWFVADARAPGARRLVTRGDSGAPGPWGWRGKEDLRAVVDAPFEQGDCWPEPLLRRLDDGLPGRVGTIHGYGNAIVPQLAAEFIVACAEAING